MRFLVLVVAVAVAAPFARPAVAQDTTVEVQVAPREVPANGQVRVTIVVSGPDAGNATIESQPRGLNLIPGGGISTSSSFQIINGAMSSSKTFALTYLPSGSGQAQVPSFTVLVAGARHTTTPVPVSITATSTQTPPSGTRAESAPGIQIKVLTDVDRRSIYQGEAISLKYRLLFRTRVTGLQSPRALEPVPHFVVEDMDVDRQVARVQHEGLEWNAAILFARRLYPTKSGRITIEPVQFVVEAEDPNARTSFFSLRNSRRVELVAPAVAIDVKPLPSAGRPDAFSGAVGQFKMTTSLDRTDLAAGEASALSVTVEGSGALDSATPPLVPAIADVRLFEPDVKGSGRRRTWTYPLVPQTAGTIALPTIRWSYFDPATERYRTIEVKPPDLNVAPGTLTSATPGSPTGRAIRPIASDLRFIKPAPAVLVDRRGDHYRQGWFWALIGLPWIAIPVTLLVGRERERLDRSGRLRAMRARSEASRRLKSARAAVGNGDAPSAQRLASEAIAHYVADRAHRSPRGMDYETLVEVARSGGASDEAAGALRELAERLDGLRYAPSANSIGETTEWVEETERAIARLEKEWR